MLMFQEQADYEETVERFRRRLRIFMMDHDTTLGELYRFLAEGVQEIRKADNKLFTTLFSRQLEEVAERWADGRRTVTELSDLSDIVRHVEESTPESRTLGALKMIITEHVSAELHKRERVREPGIMEG